MSIGAYLEIQDTHQKINSKIFGQFTPGGGDREAGCLSGKASHMIGMNSACMTDL